MQHVPNLTCLQEFSDYKRPHKWHRMGFARALQGSIFWDTYSTWFYFPGSLDKSFLMVDIGDTCVMGWVVKSSNNKKNNYYIRSPDIMVVVLPNLIFVVLPVIFFTGALAVEWAFHIDNFLSISEKKEDDYSRLNKRSFS